VTETLQQQLHAAGYIADDTLLTALDLTIALQRPLLLEGEAGVGKTDVAAALYEWNYQRQLLAIRAHESSGTKASSIEEHIFSENYLLRRPLLQALSEPSPVVLLIDEIDRADEEFEAYLLEVLADYQITIPELGTIKALSKPHVILTSNSTRELSDALRRRCLYSWVDYPDPERESAIVQLKLPEIDQRLALQVVEFVQELRHCDLEKNPGIAETLDWAAALLNYRVKNIHEEMETVQKTLICLLKTATDLHAITPEVSSRISGKVS